MHTDYFTVFNWHQISPGFNPPQHHEYTWTQLDHFEQEVKWFAEKFKVLPLMDAIDQLKRGSLRGACAALTFDDGDVSMSDHILPLLRRYNLPATFFINTAYFDGQHSYWFPVLNYFRNNNGSSQHVGLPVELQEKAQQLRRTNNPSLYNELREAVEQHARMIPNLKSRLVSPEWLASLDGEQFAIGAHGHEHQRFSMMSADWQQKDLQENVRILSQFRAFKPIFAVPFGRECDWTDATLKIAHELKLDVVLADGGVNLKAGEYYRRIPSDGRELRPLITATLAGQ